MKVYITPDLCGELIRGRDWPKQYKAQIFFDPATLTLDGEEILQGEGNYEQLPVVVQDGLGSSALVRQLV